MTGFIQKISAVLLMAEEIEPIHLELEENRECSDKVDGLYWFGKGNTGGWSPARRVHLDMGVLSSV